MRDLSGLALAGACALGIGVGCRAHADAASSAVLPMRSAFERGLDSLGTALDRLNGALEQASGRETPPAGAVVDAFRAARASYKHLEVLLEPFGPAVVEQLNGPLERDADQSYRPLGEPAGFQVLERALFRGGARATVSRDSLRSTVRAMHGSVAALRAMTPRVSVSDAALLDALRLEMARVATLGIAGFDAQLSGDAMLESAAALEGARALVQTVAPPRASGGAVPWARADSALARAADYLRAHPNFESFNRLEFIVAYANPLARAVADARRALPPAAPLRRLWRQRAATVFDQDAFDATAFADAESPPPSPALVALGQRLFSDPVLSGPRTRSCAFCHDPGRAFTDGRATSALLRPSGGAHRNTPTLLGAAYEPALFDDLRAPSLESQAGLVLASASEMGGSADLAAERLRADSSYRTAFARALGNTPGRAITPGSVRAALAAYVRSLAVLDSRFDRAVRGDTGALSPTERLGFTVFMGKARCGTCHFAPLFSGTMPPEFVSSEPEIIGVPDRADAAHARLDADPGVADVDFQPAHRGAFKVPALRNVARTGPYMHNGVFTTLEQVVDFYDRGGGAGSGLRVSGQTLPADSLRLSVGEKRALVEFLRALTSTSLTTPARSVDRAR